MAKSKLFNEILTTIVVLAILLIAFYLYNSEYEKWEKKYSIGTVKSISAGYKSGSGAEYTFKLYKETHEGSCGIGNHKVKVGKKYIVEIPVDHFDRNLMLFEFEVPDSINAPIEGWEDIPEEIIKFNKSDIQ
jgi:hypothetical protein